MAFPLQKLLKALLFSTHQPLSAKEIQAAFARFHEQPLPLGGADLSASPSAEVLAEENETDESAEADPLYCDVPSLVTVAQIREAMDAIAAEFRASDTGLLLVEGAGGYRLLTHPRFARWIRLLRQEPSPARLSASSLETLAVVAYRQPVTRLEIEAIRGVAAEAGLNKLLERELIAIVGRAEQPGRPLQYGTTEKFLEFVAIRSIDELPASDVLSPRQIDEWLQSASEPHRPGGAEMGLDDYRTLQMPLAPGGSDSLRA